ncbi:endonuclease/exonuclease/phosphatase family protein [Streptomyces sp. NPDC051567]|uniref:endonuclease/exonuclease/phosphatase family protein n=1 Tax=Streptomyces sp. NPDC051567 TaxID=3365660 RepID=UPI00378B3449
MAGTREEAPGTTTASGTPGDATPPGGPPDLPGAAARRGRPHGAAPGGRLLAVVARGGRLLVAAGGPAGPGRTRHGRIVVALALVTALLTLLHPWLPEGPGNLGSLVQTFAPWAGAAVLALLGAALLLRSRPALASALTAAVVWGSFFVPALGDRTGTGGDLTVVSHNVDDANPDPAGTARALVASGAQLIALQELTRPATAAYARTLAATHPYHVVEDTVGLWSTRPLRDATPLPIMPWTRALRATADTPEGPVTVYVAHLASVRVRLDSGFTTRSRNEAARLLTGELRAETAERVLVVGDLNGTTGDTALAPLLSGLRPAQEEAGAGFGFTWPAAFPVARIDHVLARGLTPVSAWNLPATGSDHLPVAASLRR